MSWPRQHPLPYRENAADYFECIRDMDWPVWLDSGRPGLTTGRYDILSAAPIEQLQIADATGVAIDALLRRTLERSEASAGDVPFCGGLIGYASYELGRLWHELPPRRSGRLADDLCAGLYDWAVVVDHRLRSARLVGLGLSAESRRRWSGLCECLENPPPQTSPRALPAELLSSGLSGEAYRAGYDRIQSYIREGDVYQVNYTRRLQAASEEDAWSLYRRLRLASPAPYGAFLDYGDLQVLSNSPEQFLALEEGKVVTRPIKGTRPRGDSPVSDARLRAELIASEKDRAENLMIVDLMRNDLGRVCQPGSIEVPALFALETFASVHHLVSTVTGRLQPGKDAIDLLRASFPGGSITGAPKRRAMQVIDELEPVSRDLYCGSVFRLGFDGCFDSSIAIRTLLRRNGVLSYWAGGGIVADSQPEAEYSETRDKARVFLELTGCVE